jgi:hypothetical protein
MQPEKLLGLAIPVIFFILLGIESRYAARRFETVHRWRLTGLLFFAMVLVVGSLAPLAAAIGLARNPCGAGFKRSGPVGHSRWALGHQLFWLLAAPRRAPF